MSQKIAVYRDGRFCYFLKRKKAEKKVSVSAYRWMDEACTSIEEVPFVLVLDPEMASIGFWDGPMGTGNMVPFTRVPSRWREPEKHHYPIPACGAHGRFLSVAVINFIPETEVSA